MLKSVTGTCKKLRGHTLESRAHTRNASGETNPVTIVLSRVSVLPSTMFHAFFFPEFSFELLHLFYLFFPNLFPVPFASALQLKSCGLLLIFSLLACLVLPHT